MAKFQDFTSNLFDNTNSDWKIDGEDGRLIEEANFDAEAFEEFLFLDQDYKEMVERMRCLY